jgi:hypothetical protein
MTKGEAVVPVERVVHVAYESVERAYWYVVISRPPLNAGAEKATDS